MQSRVNKCVHEYRAAFSYYSPLIFPEILISGVQLWCIKSYKRWLCKIFGWFLFLSGILRGPFCSSADDVLEDICVYLPWAVAALCTWKMVTTFWSHNQGSEDEDKPKKAVHPSAFLIQPFSSPVPLSLHHVLHSFLSSQILITVIWGLLGRNDCTRCHISQDVEPLKNLGFLTWPHQDLGYPLQSVAMFWGYFFFFE